MTEFASVNFKSTIVRFTPEGHATIAAWSKAAKMSRSEYIKYLMNVGVRALREKQKDLKA